MECSLFISIFQHFLHISNSIYKLFSRAYKDVRTASLAAGHIILKIRMKLPKMNNAVKFHYQCIYLQMTHKHTFIYYPVRRSIGCGWWFGSWGSGRTLWLGQSSSSPLFWVASPQPASQSSDSKLCPWCQTSPGRGNGSASGTSLCRNRTQLQEGIKVGKR